MTIQDYDMEFRQRYVSVCRGCGKTHILITQEDRHPEYYTDVDLVCECDEIVEFNLPVN